MSQSKAWVFPTLILIQTLWIEFGFRMTQGKVRYLVNILKYSKLSIF